MPAILNLSTTPGSIERRDRYSTKTFELLGASLARTSVAVATVADIRIAVQAFGHGVRAAHPDASFLVSILVRKGDRKPRGYDAAYLRNGFGQEDFMRVVDKRTKPAAVRSDASTAAASAAA